jgi:hypothetical protein
LSDYDGPCNFFWWKGGGLYQTGSEFDEVSRYVQVWFDECLQNGSYMNRGGQDEIWRRDPNPAGNRNLN